MTWNDNYLHHHSVHRDVINSGALMSTLVYEPFMSILNQMAPIFLSRSKELLKLVRFVSDPENFSEVSPELFPDAAVDDEVGRGVDRKEEVVKVQQVKHQDLKREQFSSLGLFFYSTGIR